MNQPWRQKLQGVQPGGCFGAVSPECYQAVLKASAGRPVYYTPATARLSRFKQHTTRKEIATLGWCGIPDSAVNFGSDLKRHSMFLEITAVTGFQPHVSGRRFTYDTMQAFYDSIDMLVCTSVSEGGPLPIFEAIACGVPVISTPVGLVNEMTSIGKFQTAREAIDLVQLLRDPTVRQQYAADQYTELKSMSMEGLIRHWDRFFQACSRRQPTPVFLSL